LARRRLALRICIRMVIVVAIETSTKTMPMMMSSGRPNVIM